jgi:hypothetical protein
VLEYTQTVPAIQMNLDAAKIGCGAYSCHYGNTAAIGAAVVVARTIASARSLLLHAAALLLLLVIMPLYTAARVIKCYRMIDGHTHYTSTEPSTIINTS